MVLEHDHPFLHWDLLIEVGHALAAWRLLRPIQAEVWLPAERLPDHRTRYLSYEGPVSGNRGRVVRCLAGQLSTGQSDWNLTDSIGPLPLQSPSEYVELTGRHLQTATPEWQFR